MEVEVNPNVSVETKGETLDIRAGESVTFDDLIDIPPPKSAEPPPEEEQRDDGANDQDQTDDQDEDDVEGEKEDPDEEHVSGETGPDDEKAEFRAVKGEYDGESVELAGETVFPTKVAGKMEQPTLTELQQNYSGKINWDRKNQEVHQKQTELQKQVDSYEANQSELEGAVGRMLDKSKEDPHAFLNVVAELHGIDPVELKMKTIKKQVETLEPLIKMSESERAAYFERLEVKFEKEVLAAQKAARADEQSKQELTTKATEARDRYGISEEDYREAYQTAKKHMPDGKKPGPVEVITVNRHFMAMAALDEAGKDWVESLDLSTESGLQTYNRQLELVRKLAIDNPDWTREDLEEVVSSAISDQSAKNLGRKVLSTKSGKARSVTRDGKPKKNKKVLTSFEQLD